jgi:hypothetical protein
MTMRAVILALVRSARRKIMTLTPKQAVALLPTGEAIGEATQDDWRAEFVRAYREHKENEKLGPASMTAEDRQPIGAWLNRDHEFNEAVVLLKAYLRQRGKKIGGR